jgi:hypothetical protein
MSWQQAADYRQTRSGVDGVIQSEENADGLVISKHMCTGVSKVSEVIDFSQEADGAMIAYGLSDTLDELKVLLPATHRTYRSRCTVAVPAP